MDVGIIGFAKGGKTTLFNALTGSEAEVGGYSAAGAQPNVAVVEVPDPRLDRLVEFYEAKKIVRAAITFIDVVGVPQGESGVLSEDLIQAVVNCDALVAVVAGFEQDGTKPDAQKMAEAGAEGIQAELLLYDLARIETRIERIEKSIGRQKPEVKIAMQRELDTLGICKTALEEEQPLRAVEFDLEQDKILRAFQLLTLKPLILVVNLAEDDIARASEVEQAVAKGGLPAGTAVVACCAESEMEIAQLDDAAERAEFLADFGIQEPAIERLIRTTFETLGLLTFFTAGPKEVHAWTLRQGEPVLRAAGTIHSDLERGFIRAEVINGDLLIELGSEAEAKKQGKLRVEGKQYTVATGDVIEIRFSV